jgi:hypothetical protein
MTRSIDTPPLRRGQVLAAIAGAELLTELIRGSLERAYGQMAREIGPKGTNG